MLNTCAHVLYSRYFGGIFEVLLIANCIFNLILAASQFRIRCMKTVKQPVPQHCNSFDINRVLTVIKNLEKSWKFKMQIPGPGKVMENNIFPKVLEKSWKCN